ncbi:FAD/NAD(P)-binding domain-containing protein [Stipitochalara longipes BDJ]|nr:FAD/NAD(P)-binding domain-containing protein [Stipitochalara longipes BDJ]
MASSPQGSATLISTSSIPSTLEGQQLQYVPTEAPSLHLEVIVVGAGIAGLAAATALRRAGHRVKIFEQSHLNSEIGAAIHVGPNVSRVLHKLGYSKERLRGKAALKSWQITLYNSDAEILADMPSTATIERQGFPWFLAHRVDLHNELKHLAIDADGEGPPASLNLGAKVVSVDAENGLVALASGETWGADLVIAADGMHSAIRELLFDATKPFPTGEAAYRFIIDMDQVVNDPKCLQTSLSDGRCRIVMGLDKRVVLYPCRNYSLLNLVCIHRTEHPGEVGSGWNSASSVDNVLETYQDFSPKVTNILKKGQNVKCWPLLQRNPIESWIKGRLCIIGDAAHPMLPHQGQGGGQAIEDGAALGALFVMGSKRDNVHRLLELWQQVRKQRASTVEWLSATQAAGKATLPRKYLLQRQSQ